MLNEIITRFVKYDELCLCQPLIFNTRIERCFFFFPWVDLKGQFVQFMWCTAERFIKLTFQIH